MELFFIFLAAVVLLVLWNMFKPKQWRPIIPPEPVDIPEKSKPVPEPAPADLGGTVFKDGEIATTIVMGDKVAIFTPFGWDNYDVLVVSGGEAVAQNEFHEIRLVQRPGFFSDSVAEKLKLSSGTAWVVDDVIDRATGKSYKKEPSFFKVDQRDARLRQQDYLQAESYYADDGFDFLEDLVFLYLLFGDGFYEPYDAYVDLQPDWQGDELVVAEPHAHPTPEEMGVEPEHPLDPAWDKPEPAEWNKPAESVSDEGFDDLKSPKPDPPAYEPPAYEPPAEDTTSKWDTGGGGGGGWGGSDGGSSDFGGGDD